MNNRKSAIILIILITCVLLIMLLLSYMNASNDVSNHEWFLTLNPNLYVNVILIILLVVGIIIGCILYFYVVIHIEDLKKQCFINKSVFFTCMLTIILFEIIQNYSNLSTDETDSIWKSTFKIFLSTLFGVMIGGSICLMLTIFVMSFFWCFQSRFETVFGKSNARVSQTNTTV